MDFGGQYDQSSWANVATAAAAWIALVLSLLGLLVSWRAIRLAENQERRRRPVLVPYLLDGFVQSRRDPRARVFGFLLSVSNPADSDNAVAGVDLHLTYTTTTCQQMTIKVRANTTLGNSFGKRIGSTMTTPVRLDAHQTISGWVFFLVDEAILEGAVVDAYSVQLTDTQGDHAVVQPIIVREYDDEAQAPAPRDSGPQRA